MSNWSNTDVNLSKPKYLNVNDSNNSNANTYGVSLLEKQQMANNKSFSNSAAHMGWVKIIPQYTDSSGNIRRKAETLVVMSTPISGNANVQISGNSAVSNGNVTIGANITASIANGNTFAIFSANAQPYITNSSLLIIGTQGPFSVNVWSTTNVALNTAATAAVTTQPVWLAGANLVVSGTNTRYDKELKVGDIMVVGNVGDAFQATTKRVVSITNATSLIVNTAFANVNSSLPVYVGDSAWFPLT